MLISSLRLVLLAVEGGEWQEMNPLNLDTVKLIRLTHLEREAFITFIMINDQSQGKISPIKVVVCGKHIRATLTMSITVSSSVM